MVWSLLFTSTTSTVASASSSPVSLPLPSLSFLPLFFSSFSWTFILVACALVLALAGWLYHYSYHIAAPPQLLFQHSLHNQRVLERCPSLTHPSHRYLPTPWLSNPHLQSLMFTQRAPPPRRVEREFVRSYDNELLVLDWVSVSHMCDERSPVAILLHGITGHSEQPTMQCLSSAIAEAGFRSVIFNRRGCHVEAPLHGDRTYAYGDFKDMDYVVEHVHERYPKAPLFALGVSCGANILVNFMGAAGPNCRLAAGISVSNGFRIAEGVSVLPWFYDYALATLCKDFFAYRHEHKFSSRDDISWHELQRVSSAREFDDMFTRKIHGFDSVDEYYDAQSSVNFLNQVSRPLLILNARDDPLIDLSLIPLDEHRVNEHLIFAVTERGGHVGFIEGIDGRASSYMERVAVEFFKSVLQEPEAALAANCD